jgi:hypothetical protein
VTPQQIIENVFAGYLVPGKTYHSLLPADLALWYCYTVDGGHSICCLLEGQFDEDDPDLDQSLCPCPVTAVLRAGWRTHNGYPVTKLEYSSEVGLITDPKDDEF